MNLTGHNPKLKPVTPKTCPCGKNKYEQCLDCNEARDRSVKLRQEQNKKDPSQPSVALY